MIDLGTTIFRYDATREIAFCTIFFLVAVVPPGLRWWRSRGDEALARTSRRQFAGRLFLAALLLPALAWAMSDGRLGATIRQRQERLIGESRFRRFLGGVDLQGTGLRLTSQELYGRRLVFLEGNKRGERLRIDGFLASDGRPLQEILETRIGSRIGP